MGGKDTPHYIFIDAGSKGTIDLPCDAWASESWVTLLHLNDGLDEFRRWASGAGFSFAVG